MNMDNYGQIILGAGVTAGFHPVSYVKTLIQIGYEPLPPTPTKSIFGRKVLAFPGLFKYLSIIRKEDGFFGMYRGLGARLVGGTLGSLVTNAVNVNLRGEQYQKKSAQQSSEIDGDEESYSDQLIAMAKETSYETVARCAGVFIAHPFHVIMIRQMAQYVGKETEYRNIFSSAGEIYEKEGILGFFAGLMPRMVGEVLTIWLANTLAHILNTYLIPKTEGANYMRGYTAAVSSLMVTQVTYPFMLVSNVMAVNDTSLKAGNPPYASYYPSWIDCWRHLSRQHALKRGSSVFMRYTINPTK